MRSIILHYHLFKNAGTSVDQILKRNFGDQWVTNEFPRRHGGNTALVEDWITSTPEAVAFSSHTMIGPLPQLDGVRILPIVMLRDPLSRIRSAYQFEATQVSDTPGAKLARSTDLENYVRTRLSWENDRQCRNFQTERLGSMIRGDAPELDRAIEASVQIRNAGILGQVERFDDAMAALKTRLADTYPDFDATTIKANVSSKSTAPDLDPVLKDLLTEANALDLALLAEL